MTDDHRRDHHDGEQLAITDNVAEHRFEATVDGGVAALWYSKHGDRIIVTHTEVPAALEGRGIAAQLARHALDRARSEGLRVVPRCPYVTSYIARHPEYQDLVTSG